MNGIDEIKRFDASRLPVHMDAEVKDFDPSKYYAKKAGHKKDRSIYAVRYGSIMRRC